MESAIIVDFGLIFTGLCCNVMPWSLLLCMVSWSLQISRAMSHGHKQWWQQGREGEMSWKTLVPDFYPRIPLEKQKRATPQTSYRVPTHPSHSTVLPPPRCTSCEELSPLVHVLCFLPLGKRILKKPRPDLLGSGLVSPAKMPGGRVGGNGGLRWQDDRGEQGSQLVRPGARKLPSTRGA